MHSLTRRPLVDALAKLRTLRRQMAEREHLRVGRERSAALARLESATRQLDEWRAELPVRERSIVDALARQPVAVIDIEAAQDTIRVLDEQLHALGDARENRVHDHANSTETHRLTAIARTESIRRERKFAYLKKRHIGLANKREARADEVELEELVAPFRFASSKRGADQ